MHIPRKIISLAMGGVALLGMVGAASAAQAVATGNVNVRSGPSAQYERVGSLQRNQLVEVTGCRGGWCYVEKRGQDGWVSANYLQQVRSQQSSRPSINFSFSFGSPPVVRPPRHQGGNDGGWNGNGGNGGWNGNNGGWNGGHNNNGGWNGNNGGWNGNHGGWND